MDINNLNEIYTRLRALEIEMGKVKTWSEDHQDICGERYNIINKDIAEMKASLTNGFTDVTTAVNTIKLDIKQKEENTVKEHKSALGWLVKILGAAVIGLIVYIWTNKVIG